MIKFQRGGIVVQDNTRQRKLQEAARRNQAVIYDADKAMQKSGFIKVNDPNVQYRAYTNGTVVVDDVSPGNVGLTFFKKPKLLDFNLQTVPSWTSQGFTLKNGGKFKS